MSETPVQQVRMRRISTWGRPRPNRKPTFAPFFGKIIRMANRWLAGFAVLLTLVCIALIVYLAYGVTFTNLYASDGTIFSCQVAINQGK